MKTALALLASLAAAVTGFCANIKLEWDPPENGVPTSYTVFALAGGQPWTVTGVTNTSVVLSNLVAGVRHSFFVVALSDMGVSPQSNIASITPSEPIDVVIPQIDPPTDLKLAGILLGNDTHWTLGLKWTASSNALGYKVTSRSQDGSAFTEIRTASTTAQIAKLPFGTTNNITITALDSLGNESVPTDPLVAIVSAFPLQLRKVAYTNLFQLP